MELLIAVICIIGKLIQEAFQRSRADKYANAHICRH